MTITTIPALDRTSATFKTDVDTFFGSQLPAFASEANALAADVNAKQELATESATTATAQAELATSAADIATAKANLTAADREQTGLDRATTEADRLATSADRAAINSAKDQAIEYAAEAAASAASASAVSGIPSIEGNGGKFFRVATDGLTTEWADSASVTLTGNLTPCATQTTILTITNYDSATAYGVTATGGTASLSGDTITYVAGATAGVFAITITAGTATRSVPITVQAATVAAPSITAPANGATNIGQSPTITTGAFSVIGATDTHLNTDYEIRTAAAGGGTLIASSLADSTNKLSWTMPASLLAVATTYYARARHRGTALGAGAWSEVSFTTAAAFTPTVPGTPYQGGFYAGRITIGGSTYAIIAAPKASGHSTSKAWKASADSTSGTLSVNDGLANSNAMNNANHPAAQFCRGLTIGGYNDWYLPSRDELEVCYRKLKPTTGANTVYASRTANFGAGGNGVDEQGNGDNDNSSPAGAAYTTSDPAMTAAAAFHSGGAECFDSAYYWSSTEFVATSAWIQNFSTGSQNYTNKPNAYCVRAVRKVLI